MRFAFGAGGTGGHIMPAIALAEELRARGHESIFIGNGASLEERLATAEQYPFHKIRVQKLYRSLTPSNLAFPFRLGSSILKCREILKKQRIDAVITTGGFVAGPVALAAITLRIPGFLHESNSYPGLTTRRLRRHLDRLYISFDESRAYLNGAELRNFGIPIKKIEADDFSLEDIGLIEGKKTLLITGGSQGSFALNSAVSDSVDALLDSDWQIIWQTGKRSYAEFWQMHKNTPGLYLFDFSRSLPAMMLKSDLAITRSGAMTLAELESSALPAILIPLPSSAGNHQYHNALAQVKKGVAQILSQDGLNPVRLLDAINTADTGSMREKLTKLPVNNASELIVTDILSCIKER